jgi:peptidyl-prolyl cis-trans isomerase A (cyclophilin A)
MTLLIDRRALLACGLTLVAGPALAQAETGLVRVAMNTGKGVITLDLNVGKAPITARNFLRYVDLRRYDGASIFRASRVAGAPQTGVIEGGITGDASKVLRPIAHESTIKTGLTHKDGTISMANRGAGTATSDFFICVGDQPSFDADPAAPTTQIGFAAFGQVVDGMDVVRAILASPTSQTARVAAMRGEMLSPPVPIRSVRRVG